MAEITIYTSPAPSEADWYGWPWEYVGPTPPAPDPTINLQSVVPDGALALVLTFDRAPAGDALDVAAYALSSVGGAIGYLPAIVAVAYDPDPLHEFPHVVRLTLSEPATGGEDYRVTVAGIVGPCDEALGDASADFVAIAPLPEVVAAAAVGFLRAVVDFDAPMGATLPADWTLERVDTADVVVVDAVATSGTRAILSLASAMVPGKSYAVTAPATARDTSGNLVDPAHKSATFATAPVSGTLTIGATGGTVRIRFVDVAGANPQITEV